LIDLNGIELREEYQLPIHSASLQHCKESFDAVVIAASVGAGKTVNIAALAKQVSSVGGSVLVLARQGELIEQNSKMAWRCGLKNSVFSASLNSKSTFYPVVFGTEGTVARSLDTDFKDRKFNVILIDECHMVDHVDLLDALNPKKQGAEYTQYTKIITHFLRLNPKTRIIGYTGSPYRGKEDIIGGFWKKKIYDVSTMYLIGLGYLVPPTFGFGDDLHKYNLSEWTPDQSTTSASDFSTKELAAMSRQIVKEKQITEVIIEEVIEITKERGGVMITCAGKKHCEQVAEFLPRGTWSIITDSTSTKNRRQALIDAREGKIKFILQIGCLTTGVNVPNWDTSVLLRRIGSLTLLTQLIGRVLRIPEQEDIDRGCTKSDALILDYTDTFASFGDIYDDPMLDKARLEKGKQSDETQLCPECDQVNSMFAVRCIGESKDRRVAERCDHFFKYNMCFRCNTKNAPTASNCRKCKAIMIDPAQKLKGKAYNDDDYKKVLSMEWELGKAKGLWIKYYLDSVFTKQGIESQEIAKEYYDPFSAEHHHKVRWNNFLNAHISGQGWRYQIKQKRSLREIMHTKAMFDIPTHITHRLNEKTISIIARRKFLSGREAK
jgi:DNA repair protein RadD